MSFKTGTATDYLDLLDQVRAFVTTDAALVASGQNWQQLAWGGAVPGTELYLRGPGISGDKSIFVGVRAYQNPTADWYNWAARPFLGYLTSSVWATQPGAGPEIGCTLWNQPMQYWLVANGDRIIVAVQVSTVYQILHLGHLNQIYGRPSQFKLPIMCAGTMPAPNTWRWSSTEANHRFFHTGGVMSPLRYIDGNWLTNLESWPYSLNGVLRESYGDQYPILPIVFSEGVRPTVFGEVDGLFWIPGFGNAAGNTFTLDGDEYVVLQNVFRTGYNDYVALRLR